MKIGFSVVLLLFSLKIVLAQPLSEARNVENAAKKGTISGKIIEAGSNVLLEYANVAIYSMRDSSLAGGGISNAQGEFEVGGLNPGRYYLDAKYIGYDHTIIENLIISREKLSLNIGTLELNPATENIKEVTVTAQENPIAYDIDKKVVDPSHFPTAAGGTATDVLAQTPSVVVDIEGNVSLRGSSNFTVLIDGRPTPFDPADALDQIPASTIRNIEIITNPSAKYDPDGNGGIININTKKSKLIGVSGIVNATADTYGSLSGDFLLNYKMEKFNVFLSGNKSNRYGRGTYNSLSETYGQDTIITTSKGDNERGRDSWSVKSGFDYFINDLNTLSFNVSLNGRNRISGGISDFSEISTNGYELYSTSESNSKGASKNVAFSLDYKKTYEKEGQEFTAYAYYETGPGEEFSYFDQFDGNGVLLNGQNNWENGDGTEFMFKADYVYPFNDNAKLEAGYQARMDRDFEWNDVHWYTQKDNYEPSSASEYYSDTDFSRDIHSLYSTFSNKAGIFGYQLGLRTEYTNRTMEYSNSADEYTINRWDFFPTAHFTFQLPSQQQLISSYSRRIQRPRGYYLEPFITYTDAYNVRTGNPAIEPEYIDSYELGYQKTLGKKGFLSAELYHKKTNNKIERINSVYTENILLQTVDNVGSDYSTGLELMLNLRPNDWWSFSLMGNVYDYRAEGEIDGRSLDTQSNNWHSRFSNTFSILKNTTLQFDAMYHSPSKSLQGEREGFMFTNLAVRQDLFKEKLKVTLSVRDVLNTAKFGFVSSGPNFYAERNFDMKSPVFALTLSYKINNYRQKREGRGEGESDMMNMGNEEF